MQILLFDLPGYCDDDWQGYRTQGYRTGQSYGTIVQVYRTRGYRTRGYRTGLLYRAIAQVYRAGLSLTGLTCRAIV